LGVQVKLETGRRGQFEILVDDRVVLARKGGLIAKIVGRPWPTDEDVLSAVRNGPA